MQTLANGPDQSKAAIREIALKTLPFSAEQVAADLAKTRPEPFFRTAEQSGGGRSMGAGRTEGVCGAGHWQRTRCA